MEWLYKRTSLGKIQQWGADFPIQPNGKELYFITAFGQLDGKIQQVNTIVKEGKQKRNVEQQVWFEIKALYKSKKDEGYKSLEDLKIYPHESMPIYWTEKEEDGTYDLDFILDIRLPQTNTTKDGFFKVMLSQPISRTLKGIIKDIWHKVKYPIAGEYKLDGVRCTMQRRPEEKGDFFLDLFINPVMSLSREGMDYDFGTTKIREKLEPIFAKYPNLILDGELYKHDIPQNHISGAMRSKSGGEYKYVWNIMEYHVWDCIDLTLTYQERRTFLINLHTEFPNTFILNDCRILSSKEEVDIYEEEAVSLGYEGIMLKNLEGMYKPDHRSYDSIKVKRFFDDEFEIIGYQLGKRGVQDLVIALQTQHGAEFLATAMGTVEEKESLRKSIHNKLGLRGTVKYKFISENGKPSHAQFKGLR